MTGVLFCVFAGVLLLNVPISFCLAISSLAALAVSQKVPLLIVVQRMFTGVDSFTLLCIPLFMIAGSLMEYGGISRRLIALAQNMVGKVWGGLGHVTVLACMFFAAISGSAPATVVAVGSVMVPAMVESGYDKRYACALVAAAGCIGVIIPPSVLFVTYGVTMNQSIGHLFMAGILPGLIIGGSLMIVNYCIARSRGYRSAHQSTLNTFLTTLKDASWALLMPLIILGGIYSGVFTPTESAGVACVYAVFIGLFIYRELDLGRIFKAFRTAGTTSAMVMMIVACATGMGWILTTENVPTKLAMYISSLTSETWILLMFLNIALLIIGCFMEPNSTIIILGPILLPLLQSHNIDLIHFGVVMVANVTIGLCTPPLGVNLFVGTGLRKDVTFNGVVRAIVPFLCILIVDLMLFTYIPSISTALIHFFGI